MRRITLSDKRALKIGGLCALGILTAAGLISCGSDSSTPAATPSATPAPAAPAPAAPLPTEVSGVIATGAAVANAAITVKDSDAVTTDITGTADANGAYKLDVSTLKPPLVVIATGTQNGEAVSIVAVVPTLTGNANNTANVTSLTNAIAALIAPGGDLNALSTPATLSSSASAAKVTDATALVVNTLKTDPVISALLGAGYNPLSTVFVADGTGLDSVLDRLEVTASASGVTIASLTAPVSDSGTPEPVILTAAATATPTLVPSLPASVATSSLPSATEMTTLAQKLETCLAQPKATRVTLDPTGEATAISAACDFAPKSSAFTWKSGGRSWLQSQGTFFFSRDYATGAKRGTPSISTVLSPVNVTDAKTFKHPICNTSTCVVMRIPIITASGKTFLTDWQMGKVSGAWDYVGNQLPYGIGVQQRVTRKIAQNTSFETASPTNYFAQSRTEAVARLNFDPSIGATSDVRSVRWTGPGLPAAGVVSQRSRRCGTDDRFPISNQEGSLFVNNSSTIQLFNTGGGIDFLLDAAKIDGTAITLPTPTTGWATNASPANQDVRSSPFTGTVPAWSTYKAEIFYFANTTGVADEIIVVRTDSAFESASSGASKAWPSLSATDATSYLTPTGSKAGSLTNFAQTMSWTAPTGTYVNGSYLFSQNRLTLTNSQSETFAYEKRSVISFLPTAYGDLSATGYQFGNPRSGASMSLMTETSGSNPNPRCTGGELVVLDATNTSSYREAGLGFRGTDKKFYNSVYFWTY